MISAEERIALKKIITMYMPNTPFNIIDRIEIYLYRAANGDSTIYNDFINIKKRIEAVFIEFEQKKQDSIRRTVMTRYRTPKKAKNEEVSSSVEETKLKAEEASSRVEETNAKNEEEAKLMSEEASSKNGRLKRTSVGSKKIRSSEATSSEATSSGATSSEAISSEATSSGAISSEVMTSEAMTSEAISSESKVKKLKVGSDFEEPKIYIELLNIQLLDEYEEYIQVADILSEMSKKN